MGRKGVRGRETMVQEMSIGCLLHNPGWGPGPQPRHVPWLRITPATIWFTGQYSNHWATPTRARFCLNWSVWWQPGAPKFADAQGGWGPWLELTKKDLQEICLNGVGVPFRRRIEIKGNRCCLRSQPWCVGPNSGGFAVGFQAATFCLHGWGQLRSKVSSTSWSPRLDWEVFFILTQITISSLFPVNRLSFV